MRIRRKPWARPELEACEFCVKDPGELKGKWRQSFAKDQPLYVELGCGKGGFISQVSAANQDINYVAIDIKSEMAAYARRKTVAEFEKAGIEKIENVKLLVHNIENIDEVFDENDKIDRIYINFCNPWPRGKHNKRRLTYPKKLLRYRTYFNEGGELWFKTDDDELFADSLEYFKETGYSIKYITYDLHESGFEENTVTEHEKMFSDEGIKIKFLIAVPEKQ